MSEWTEIEWTDGGGRVYPIFVFRPYEYWTGDKEHVMFEVDWSPLIGGLPRVSPKQPSKIRVTLSRPLTWAEWEKLIDVVAFQYEDEGAFHNVPVTFKKDQGSNFNLIWVEGNTHSRELFAAFANFIAEEFVNVYPKAVYTKQEAKR